MESEGKAAGGPGGAATAQLVVECDDSGHRVQRLVVHTEAPDEFIDVTNMFLMRFSSQNALE